MTTALTVETDPAQLCCEPSSQPVLNAVDAQESARVLKALSDPNRLRLLSIVKAGDGGEACVCDLTEPLDLGQPTVSHHLKILVDAGLLEREKRGTWAYYSLVPGALEAASARILGL
ncbi:transcriptional regulator [Arthrobacter psychrolactophilus]|uniref:Transcriptional regulator n=1 Tax=Arthrobacter psychrolactophilus TaxID=92442 RepID=A0A2V5JKI7_9MICC|nr:metalloregulator ArsR/SmtB family transcription factor [Arthrobacter psychrolactophilus]PYI38026.1 transcriptional regulator [Arthrobacter psychrolactophilus]